MVETEKTATVIDLAITRSQARAVGRSKLVSSVNGGEKKSGKKGGKRSGKVVKKGRKWKKEERGDRPSREIRRQINCDPRSINNTARAVSVRARKRMEEDRGGRGRRSTTLRSRPCQGNASLA